MLLKDRIIFCLLKDEKACVDSLEKRMKFSLMKLFGAGRFAPTRQNGPAHKTGNSLNRIFRIEEFPGYLVRNR